MISFRRYEFGSADSGYDRLSCFYRDGDECPNSKALLNFCPFAMEFIKDLP